MRNLAIKALVLGGIVASAAGTTILAPGWKTCLDEWWVDAAFCCNIGTPEAVASCLAGADDALGICLTEIPSSEPKPTKDACKEEYRAMVVKCDQTPPCGTGHAAGKSACQAAARTFQRWCLGGLATIDGEVDLDSTPLWSSPPTSITVGNNVQFTLTTNDPLVAGVKLVAYRSDANPSDPDALFLLGSASSQSLGGDLVEWTLTENTANWPVEEGEQRVMVWAESETQTETGRTLYDSALPIYIDLQF